MKIIIALHTVIQSYFKNQIQKIWKNEQGDVTSTVIIIAVLIVAAVAAGVVITNYISSQTSKIS
ncbi:hypothetical protein [Candidatus Poriferisocius sp.]|uniref:hypothetical protein n=1 Tax=Candidatus Poriferisocius sp. TaxID=3101276 RepID=UPI003B01F96F